LVAKKARGTVKYYDSYQMTIILTIIIGSSCSAGNDSKKYSIENSAKVAQQPISLARYIAEGYVFFINSGAAPPLAL
jgi:hypothetical protein